MRQSISKEERERFCLAYLRTMDAELAAKAVGRTDGYTLLGEAGVVKRLEAMRETPAATRADVVRQMCRLAFGQVNDAVGLALSGGRAADAEALDLSAVAECKVTEKGVELKFIDRVRALETLWNLLDEGDNRAERFFQALDAAGQRGRADGTDGVF